MRIIFSNHARIKISQRKIPKSYVTQVISFPDFIHYNPSGRDVFYKKFTKLYLKVAAKKLRTGIIVITAHWVAKMPSQ